MRQLASAWRPAWILGRRNYLLEIPDLGGKSNFRQNPIEIDLKTFGRFTMATQYLLLLDVFTFRRFI